MQIQRDLYGNKIVQSDVQSRHDISCHKHVPGDKTNQLAVFQFANLCNDGDCTCRTKLVANQIGRFRKQWPFLGSILLRTCFFFNSTGNKHIHDLTDIGNTEVLFKLQAHGGSWYYASYQDFNVASETEDFRMDFDETTYNGTAGASVHVI